MTISQSLVRSWLEARVCADRALAAMRGSNRGRHVEDFKDCSMSARISPSAAIDTCRQRKSPTWTWRDTLHRPTSARAATSSHMAEAGVAHDVERGRRDRARQSCERRRRPSGSPVPPPMGTFFKTRVEAAKKAR